MRCEFLYKYFTSSFCLLQIAISSQDNFISWKCWTKSIKIMIWEIWFYFTFRGIIFCLLFAKGSINLNKFKPKFLYSQLFRYSCFKCVGKLSVCGSCVNMQIARQICRAGCIQRLPRHWRGEKAKSYFELTAYIKWLPYLALQWRQWNFAKCVPGNSLNQKHPRHSGGTREEARKH